MSDTSGTSTGIGQQGISDASSRHNETHYHLRQHLGEVRTAIPVKIVAVQGGGVGAPPTVTVMVMVKTMDGGGNVFSHGQIFDIPCTRNQGGTNAIINDPKVDDVGLMSVSDRDISALKANNGQESQPGSYRRHDLADGVYHGPMLNQATPTQYLNFTENGLEIVDMNGNKIVFSPNGISVTAVGSGLTCNNNITAGAGTGDSVDLQGHVHPGTTKPTPGT